jgi:oligoribonuclease NrnB/cAMP/cGMP phosphodiesterase (DHH superfamily)
MGCCDDPTEPEKFSRSDLVRIQQEYGNLVRDLFTENPEKVILKQLNRANVYLRELAALNAYHVSARKHAIELLENDSISILQRIIDKEAETEIGLFAQQRIEDLKKDSGFFRKIFD